VRFLHGYIERLDELDLAPASFDVIVSNCVVNLSPDKEAVLRGVQRLLKPGGEFYFSDVYADRRVPDAVERPGAVWRMPGRRAVLERLPRLARQAGFADPRLVEDRPLAVTDPDLAPRTGNGVNFHSATYRLFKLDGLESDCEDYGQAVVYRGSIAQHAQAFVLDKHHRIEAGRVFPVCGNTFRMLKESRLAPHFDFIGDFSRHYGMFDRAAARRCRSMALSWATGAGAVSRRRMPGPAPP
jgi:arsenite methyltransferase